MGFSTVKFLEKKKVIQFFGMSLILAPFVNIYLVLYTKIQDYNLTWAQVNIIKTLKSGVVDNYILSVISIIIGIVMLRGSTKAWRAALFLVGVHIVLQILNYKTTAKGNILWWPFLMVNVSVFMFIADQLVWKIEIPQMASRPLNKSPDAVQFKSSQAATPIVRLKTFKKIYLRHTDPAPWAEVKNMNSQGFQAHCLAKPSDELIAEASARIIVMKLAPNFVVHARLKQHKDKIFTFEFINLSEQHNELINAWFKKIAA